ncbi:phytoene dehydrogenase [Bdellovibrio bacteriovorus]|uniref:Phytoene dehydrogenase n=1 Tax=Bdellovibrio bacteriovorus TaxID=959 RepID=A0A162GQY8_BDEBC|nr:phytoene desaturase [Bdellovibrio bacteriovorus]KYG68739.1 phytoene dehydrogenase [Bdellovibrio bacteriovorus]
MNRKKAAVIGSGFGGLASAIRLQTAGFDVTIFEKRDLPGGRAYVFKENGFTFDAGPTVITAPETLTELFSISGRKIEDYVELMKVEPFYKLFWHDGVQFDYGGDVEDTIGQIKKISPSDAEGYRKFLSYSKDVYHEGYEKLAAKPFLNVWSMVKTAPQLMRLRADRSVYDTVGRYIKNEHLRQAFSFHSLLVGGNPFSTSSIYTLIHYLERKGGVYFPRGGTGALVQALVKLFKELGGKIELSCEVDEILTTGQKVTGLKLKDGRTQKFDLVVSNGDVVHTYKHLLRSEKATKETARRVESMRHSMALFLIYFGTKKTYPELAHHNVIFGPRYRGLLDDIFKRGKLPDDFSLYLHAPTRTDASLAPAGHECFYVLSPVAHLGNLKVDWSVEGPKYAEKIMNYLEEKYLPGLKENLVVQKIVTPDDFKKDLNAHVGSAFSLEPVLHQSAYFRTHNRDASVKGLYFVGAGTHPGAGVPGVISSAKATVSVIQEDMGRL